MVKIRLESLWPKTPKARLFLAVFVVLIIGIGIWLVYKPKASSPKPIKLADIIRQNPKLTEDDDKDGLKNWEEQIYQTNPNKADTDGDGTNDGEETTLGRDPLKAGPNDEIITKGEHGESGTKATNLTDQFTNTFIREPVTQIIVGEKPNINTDLVEAYADQLLQKSVLANAPQIKESELKKNPINSVENIQKYLQNFEIIWKTNIAPLEKELDITVTAFQNQDYSNLPKIDKNITAYQKTIDEIKLLSAPQSVWDFHVGILNFLYKIKLSAELMTRADKDPITAMLAIKDRLDLNNKLNIFLQNFQNKITEILKNTANTININYPEL